MRYVAVFLLLFSLASLSTEEMNDMNETRTTFLEEFDSYEYYPYLRKNPVVGAFKSCLISPQIVPVPPQRKLHVHFDSSTRVRLGNCIKRRRILTQPWINWNGDNYQLYTLIMINPDVPMKNVSFKNWRPWIVGNIPGRKNIFLGTTLYKYKIRLNPMEVGLQRHVFLLYRQKRGRIRFNSRDYEKGRKPIKFTLKEFVFKYNLSDPEFGNFFYSNDSEITLKM